jgi:hypothetical protein
MIMPALMAGGSFAAGNPAPLALSALSSPKVAVNAQELIEALTRMAQAGADVTGRGIPAGLTGSAMRAAYPEQESEY